MGLVTLNVCWSIIGWHALNSHAYPILQPCSPLPFWMMDGTRRRGFVQEGGAQKSYGLASCFMSVFSIQTVVLRHPPLGDKPTCVTYFSAGHISH